MDFFYFTKDWKNDVNISRQTMANWCIRSVERYLSLMECRLKEELLKSNVIHVDETPVRVKNDTEGLTVAGCWTHARRPFAEVVKTLGKKEGRIDCCL